ncbi:hypothetical protein LIER_37629 [Lithospermum erythrorhizon]|uniref:Uncharacterized protein n=1 Tax=Lithospermum erythrorhizon TaxID=34254 RepID=A0AAV3PTC7_LITER
MENIDFDPNNYSDDIEISQSETGANNDDDHDVINSNIESLEVETEVEDNGNLDDENVISHGETVEQKGETSTVAMARPRFDDNGNEIFSGKIGVFPFITILSAQCRSRNREAGTIEMKPSIYVTREVDNARTHVDPSDEQFQVAAVLSGLNLKLICQPPNSPDMNILDLEFLALYSRYNIRNLQGQLNSLCKLLLNISMNTHITR